MEEKRVHAFYFSPAHSTRTIVRAVANGILENSIQHDLTRGLSEPIELSENETVVIGVPSYSGRVPMLAVEAISKITAHGTPAILVCVYGNREYDDTLLELSDLCRERGFKVISAGAFIARHSIFPNIAENRPDKNDLETAHDFGVKSISFIAQKESENLPIKGNRPYREVKSIPLKPKGSSKCNQCGTCVTLCPVGAISDKNPRKTDREKCISCAGCIEVCPQKARKFSGLLYNIVRKQFTKKFGERKEIELLFPQK